MAGWHLKACSFLASLALVAVSFLHQLPCIEAPSSPGPSPPQKTDDQKQQQHSGAGAATGSGRIGRNLLSSGGAGCKAKSYR